MSRTKSAPYNLTRWDNPEDPLAPLTPSQKKCLSVLQDEMLPADRPSNVTAPHRKSKDDNEEKKEEKEMCYSEKIETYQELLQNYTALEKRFMSVADLKYTAYLDQLKSRRNECHQLCVEIENALQDFATLSKQYTAVSSRTTLLHEASEQLISDQQKLNSFNDEIVRHLKYFKEVDRILEKLEAPTLSVNSEIFFDLLDKIDSNMDFVQNNDSFKESSTYLVKYRHCQSKAITLIQHYVFNQFANATESILSPKETDNEPKNSDAALALFYGRFQSVLPKIKSVLEQIESKSSKRQEYETLLTECHQSYLSHRGTVLGPGVTQALNSVKERYNGDHCSLVRHSCALLLHASIDEHRLFYQFFSKTSASLNVYLEGLCTSLYDSLRPFIIHINHLETLAEICCILRIEMLDEHVQNNSEPLQGFGSICLQLLHDVQERLVFRAHLYLQSDVLNYNPSAGDLAYPEKLKMMEDIAESIREETNQLRMKRISLSSNDSGTPEAISRNHLMMDPLHYQKSSAANSPADLHGMWYPTVRRTLVCLSRLYRCVDRPVFQSLSQEAISLCVQSIESARQKINLRSTPLDAELFQVKHLLILREQIAPFQVDFTIKEYSLDFSKVKTAAFGLLEKRSRLFTLSNNALLEFLLEGAPQMKEQLIDSRKHVDAKLKSTCQRLIQHATHLLIEPVIKLLERAKMYVNSDGSSRIRQQPFGSAQEIAKTVGDTQRLIKFKLPNIQQSMQLYLANRETECILFRPIKNNIVAAFTQLLQLLSNNYTAEELLLIACPLPDQISVTLSSTSLAHGKLAQHEAQRLETAVKKVEEIGDGGVKGNTETSVSTV
ncbi:conserved oligomeric Golgi complex subunit 3 [Neodiprion pinetum]|uniref:Conserved oligomeric Golgi complex subunit 3 n=1 Tax=Neodiprion lecontei TaxID=441921 RepID=A0A6J0BYT9_NEOLC|nr:conserved oligomeric Golgi complex subunit 3 [Neodiprion lecontei]XP_046481992.1 conserved oligomeric Golgi complex subunit 3 [Neodiprion pinetum]